MNVPFVTLPTELVFDNSPLPVPTGPMRHKQHANKSGPAVKKEGSRTGVVATQPQVKSKNYKIDQRKPRRPV